MRAIVCILFVLSTWSAGNAQGILVRPDATEGSFTLWAQNRLPCPITLSATAEHYDTTFSAFIPQKHEQKLIKWPDPPEALANNLQKILHFDFSLGNPNAIHDDEYQYNLPFPEGESYMLTQGNKTNYTHSDSTSYYAFDFAMPEGSFVSAARGGRVGFVESRYKIGGENIELLEKSNRIIVCHDDGSIAVYAHLKHNGALVSVGDPIFAGQVIGLSGNTGFTTSPHLHFAVLVGRQSVPIRFRNEYTILYEGEVYEHK